MMLPKSQSFPRVHQIIVLFLVFFSFVMAAVISRTVFERLPHLEDELAYLYQARVFASGEIVADTPEPDRAYWQPFVITYNETDNSFGKYTPGWPALLAVGVLMGQRWLVNALFAALTVAAVYRLGREIFNPDVGVIAAALTAFSPMALLLNATLMGHTAALCFFTLFMYAYWRIEHGRHIWRWGLLAGVFLGMVVLARPLTAIAVTAPFILWSGVRVLLSIAHDVRTSGQTYSGFRTPRVLGPLVLLSVITVGTAAFIPYFNYTATGDATKNLYREIWDYDRVGFGEGYGRNGHTIVKGVSHARYDLSLTAGDLFGWTMQRPDDDGEFSVFGWQPGQITSEVEDHLQTDGDYFPLVGLSFFIIPFGLWVGFRNWLMRLWILATLYWLIQPLVTDASFLFGYPRVISAGWDAMLAPMIPLLNDDILLREWRNFTPIWQWLAIGGGLMLFPLLLIIVNGLRRTGEDTRLLQTRWTWLLLAVAVSLIGAHMAYWVGSQRYSTRYYFEALTAFALIGSLPIAWLARNAGYTLTLPFRRMTIRAKGRARYAFYGLVYAAFAGLLLWSLLGYSLPRVNVLYQYNRVSDHMLSMIRERQEDDRPVLVIATKQSGANFSWRGYGSLMAVTDPYLENEFIAAWNYAPGTGLRQDLIDTHPERQVIDITTNYEQSWFSDCGDTLREVPESCRLNPPED